jgi:hypothetical protein
MVEVVEISSCVFQEVVMLPHRPESLVSFFEICKLPAIRAVDDVDVLFQVKGPCITFSMLEAER